MQYSTTAAIQHEELDVILSNLLHFVDDMLSFCTIKEQWSKEMGVSNIQMMQQYTRNSLMTPIVLVKEAGYRVNRCLSVCKKIYVLRMLCAVQYELK